MTAPKTDKVDENCGYFNTQSHRKNRNLTTKTGNNDALTSSVGKPNKFDEIYRDPDRMLIDLRHRVRQEYSIK